jgi:hypothetical protein
MDCERIQEQLPAYLDGALPSSEEAFIATHLASCPRCGAVRDDLRKAGQLVGSLDEVEAPPWLKTRVMARVREERARQAGGFWRRLSPLGLKLPAAAVAGLLVAGIAVYVFKAVEPDVAPLRHAAKEPVQAPAQMEAAAPDAKAKARPAQPAAPAPPAPPAERRAEQAEVKRAPAPEAPASTVGPPVAQEPAPAPAPTEARRKASEMDEAAGRLGGSSAALKGERIAPDAAPGYPEAPRDVLARRAAPGAAQPLPYALSLQARDLARTTADVQAVLAARGARAIRPIIAERSATVAAEIHPAEIPDLQRKLQALGAVRETRGAPPAADIPIPITIEIHAEP